MMRALLLLLAPLALLRSCPDPMAYCHRAGPPPVVSNELTTLFFAGLLSGITLGGLIGMMIANPHRRRR